jgi:GNAT superfamily N-acetyltransferase
VKDAARLAWRNECEGWLALGEAQEPVGAFKLDVVQGIACAWWQGSVGEMENYIMLPPGYRGELDQALRSMAPSLKGKPNAPGSGNSSVLRYFQEDEQPDWRQKLSRFGFMMADSALLMAADLQNWSSCSEPNPQVRIKRVEESCDYQEACALMQAVFGGPLVVTRFFAQPGLSQMYVAFQERQLVAGATLWPFGGAAGIYSVGTAPEMRRQGIATAVVNQIQLDARRDGYSTATLRTVDSLIPLYARCGFKPVGRVVRWVHLRSDTR